MHNSFTTNQISENSWSATSHNFPEFSGTGNTEAEAIAAMNRAIVYYKDNNNSEFLNRIRARVQNGLACACGEPLKPDDSVLGVFS